MLKWDNYMLGCVQVSSWSPLVDTPTHTHIKETVTSSILHRAILHKYRVSLHPFYIMYYTFYGILCIYVMISINKFDVLTRRDP